MLLVNSKNKLFWFFGNTFLGIFSLTNLAIGAQDMLEIHSGTVKLIRNGKSQILQESGNTYALFASDKLQTGENTRISLYLKNNDDTVKLFSKSFFKLDELTNEGNSVALLTGKGNFKVKPPDDSLGKEQESDESTGKKNNKTDNKEELDGKLAGQFEKLSKSKILRRKKRFSVRTVSAIVGVRGTDFVVATTSESTKVLGLTGEVTLASPEIPKYEIPVKANQASHVNEGSGPSVPVSIPPEESEKIVSGEGMNSFEEVKFGPSELIGTIQERLKSDDETPRFQEEKDSEGRFLEQLDRIEELESIVDNAENVIRSATQKVLVLNMTFTNR